MRNKQWMLWTVAALAVAGAACSRQEAPDKKPGAAAGESPKGALIVATNGATKLISEMAPDDVIISINGESLTRTRFDRMLESMTATFEAANPNRPKPEIAAYKERRARMLVSEYLTKQLLVQEAARRKLAPSPERLAEVRKMAEAAAKRAGKSLEDFMAQSSEGVQGMQRSIEEQALILTLRDAQFGAKLAVSDERVRSVRESLMKRNVDLEATNAVRRVQAERLVKEIRAGADFAKLADTYSQGGDNEGGEMGEYEYAAFDDRNVKHAASMLPVGAVSDVIDTEEGWVILKVLSRKASTATEPGTVTLARILIPKEALAIIPSEADIRRQLETQRLTELQGPWLSELKRNAVIEFPYGTNLWPQAKTSGGFKR